MNILLVDDERDLNFALSEILKQNKYTVTSAFDGEEGLDEAISGIFDVIVLDVMMPKMDGFTLLKELRARKIETPVIMLTAKSETSDKLIGFKLGADDYLPKPFDTNELLARIKALLRRKERLTSDVITYNDLSLDRDSYEIFKDDKRISLGKKEFQILELLMLNAGKTLNKERLIEKIWGYDSDAEYNTIEVYVSFIRRKLTAIDCSVEIKSVRGVGYTIGVNK